jgi:ribosomal protein L16 Arg81 hydroxylase
MRNSQHCFSDWCMHELTAGPGDATRPPVIETVIGPGDALFLPVGWWHAVEALSLSVSVSFTSFQRSNAHHEEYRSYGAM